MKRRRTQLLIFLLVLPGTLGILVRAAQVSIFQHGKWTRAAAHQQERVLSIQTSRGRIYSGDGYLMASSFGRWAVQVDRRQIRYPSLFAMAATDILGENPSEIEKRMASGPRYFWLAKGLAHDQAEELRKYNPRAVYPVHHWDRSYPLGRTAAPVIGFVGRAELKLTGRTGIEKYYSTLLKGEADTCFFVTDAHGRRLELKKLHSGRPGADLRLTINARLQNVAETALIRSIEDTRAEGGSLVVLEASTGKILVMASAPLSERPTKNGGFDQNQWRIRPIQSAMEPGSTMKPFILATALSAGVVKRNEKFDCRAQGISVSEHWIRDHAAPGIYTLKEILAKSSNTGAIKISERIPRPLLWKSLNAFGFGQEIGMNLGFETSGRLWPLEKWSEMSAAGLALGQELTVSPMQLAQAFSVIANGGWLLEPRLVQSINSHGSHINDRPHLRRHVMDEALCLQLQSMLEGVVTDGTGTLAAVPGFRVAGKTGTAQNAINGGFDEIHHTAWFAGFLPLPDPRWVIVVSIENPQRDYWASTVAAPLFAEVAEAACRFEGLIPSTADEVPRV